MSTLVLDWLSYEPKLALCMCLAFTGSMSMVWAIIGAGEAGNGIEGA
jgi:hypothetical protein